ncbi:MAG: hypothetical protein CMH83_03790 [Nocardioides sp.]|nr:hypothetical protein [Nocardioides sp.]
MCPVAGGWGRQGSGVPLAERVRPGEPAASGASAGGPGPPLDSPARHCWVSDAVDALAGRESDAPVRRPGLLLEWRRTRDGWEGRVVYAARVRDHGWASVEEWVPAALLTAL